MLEGRGKVGWITSQDVGEPASERVGGPMVESPGTACRPPSATSSKLHGSSVSSGEAKSVQAQAAGSGALAGCYSTTCNRTPSKSCYHARTPITMSSPPSAATPSIFIPKASIRKSERLGLARGRHRSNTPAQPGASTSTAEHKTTTLAAKAPANPIESSKEVHTSSSPTKIHDASPLEEELQRVRIAGSVEPPQHQQHHNRDHAPESTADVKRRLFACEGNGSTDHTTKGALSPTSLSPTLPSYPFSSSSSSPPKLASSPPSRIGGPMSTALSLSLQSTHFAQQQDANRQREVLRVLEGMTGLGKRLGGWVPPTVMEEPPHPPPRGNEDEEDDEDGDDDFKFDFDDEEEERRGERAAWQRQEANEGEEEWGGEAQREYEYDEEGEGAYEEDDGGYDDDRPP